MKSYTPSYIAATLAAVSVFPAYANTEHADREEIVVTASRVEQPVTRVIGELSVFDRDDIDAAAPLDMADLLRQLPGVDVVRSGSFGSQTSVFMRGAESDHVLVLIDGVRANSSTVGVAAWADLHPSQIERIEVVRGSRSALYGSDAIGGVVQIFTRNSSGLSVSHRRGSFDTRETTVGLGAKDETGYAGITVNILETEGFSAQNDNANTPGFPAFGSFPAVPPYLHDPDNDGSERTSIAAKFGFNTEAWALDVAMQTTNGDVEVDSSFGPPESSSDQDTLSVRNTFVVSEQAELSVLLGYNRQESGSVIADRRSAESTFSYQFDGVQLLAGLGVENIHGEDPGKFDQSVSSEHVFVQALGELAAFDWQLATRVDGHENYGSQLSNSAAVGWWISDAIRLHGSYAEGFRAPNISDLFSPGFFGTYAGNPNLLPEESENIEFGLKWHIGSSWAVSATAFETDFTNLIGFSTAPPNNAANIAQAKVEGVELQAEWEAGVWFASLAVTLQKARDANNQPLLRRPEEKATLAMGYQGSALSAMLDLKAAGDSQDFGPVTLEGYEVLGASVTWKVNSSIALSLRGDNLADEVYQVANGFNTAPRSAFVTLRYNLN